MSFNGSKNSIDDLKTESALAARIRAELSPLAEAFVQKRIHVAAAESLTGGLISASFVDIPGCSSWFSDGFVTYSDEAKVRRLGVDAGLIARFTAVSAPVALEMARGARKKSGAELAVAVTGLAGPFLDGVPLPREKGHEPGLVFVACASGRGEAVRRCVFTGGRRLIREKTVLEAVLLLKSLMKNGL